jgi:predicted hydrocarbon binding protein
MLHDLVTRIAVRGALVGGSLASGNLFWVRAALGENQLRMHDCAKDGTISIGGVSEQLYGEGFVGAWHEVLGRELGERLPAALYEVGLRGARWEVQRAIDVGVWVPRLLRPFVGRKEMLEKARGSRFYRALLLESLGILFRMIMTEGGWGVVEEIDILSTPIRVVVSNTPEPRRLGHTGRCSCHLTTGIYAGYFETLFGLPFRGRETTCRARGDAACTFELALGEEAPPAAAAEAEAKAEEAPAPASAPAEAAKRGKKKASPAST